MKIKILTLAIQAAMLSVVPSMVFAADPIEVSTAQKDMNANRNLPVADADEASIEKVAVTGSRIKRDSFSLSTPMVGLDAKDIADSGIGSLADILVDQVPALSEGVSSTNSQSSVQNTGLSTIDLRSLGTDRTLTLIDGRRVVSNSYSGNYVSLSTIPTAMVEKVEIITGGASAVYGSDAIAGVVNIITQSDKTGFEINARGGETTNGGGQERTVDVGYGADFASDKGYIYASATYDKQYGLFASDRSRSKYESSFEYDTKTMCNAMNTVDGDQCMRDITPDEWRERSNDINGGRFETNAWWYDGANLKPDFKEERDGYNTYETALLKVPEDSLSAAIKMNYDISDDVKANVQVQFSRNTAFRRTDAEGQDYNDAELYIDPITGLPGMIDAGTISPNNPYVPSEIAAMAGKSVTWDRRFQEVGPVESNNERTTLRSWAGLQGSLFDTWTWDASVGYGKFEQRQRRSNEVSIRRLRNALDAEYADDGVTIQCASEDARAEGCVPVNIFGEGSISKEGADYIRANPYINTDITQLNALGFISGELFELPAGGVQSAFGVEYRRDTQEVQTDKAMRADAITFNDVPPFEGEVTVWEAFGEASLPLLRNADFAHKLDLDVSLRIADYSQKNINLMSSYRTGLLWEPIENYALRANYSRAQRAPNITELISPPRGDYDSVRDICDGVTATSTNAGHDSCRLDAGIAAAIATDGIFEDAGGSKYSPNAGNDELTEETADTYTLGFTMAPDFLEGFNLAVDYYDIKVADAIGSLSNEDILAECYNSSNAYGADNQYCGVISRDTEGQLTQIIQQELNLNDISTRGVDIALAYQWELAEYGDLSFKTNWTHVLEYSSSYMGADGLVEDDYVGELASGIFEDRGTASLTWSNDDWRIRWSTKYKSDMVDSHDRVNEWQDLNAANQAKIDAGDATAILNPETPAFLYYGSYVTHDLSVSYTMDINNSAQLRLYGGVRNIFDNQGPWVANTGDLVESGTGNYSSAYGGGVGRYGYLGAEMKF
ncbi:TonB-dependent receptor plug domain-containing protein [Shewanella morhuae]|uniref:Outer membrane cobalamin translocator n=1 Tax=Shewanella morhuae TaxID=365591 RepID=A0A379ZEF9_9GAMM|nr:TonB-dependent receptor [Shewanella morhuae]SUI60636.1 Outer membrane cobalamin translocator [Shewanella morhuae]